MRKRSNKNGDREALRQEIMGQGNKAGDKAGDKSYYPELQQRLSELERLRSLLDQATDMVLVIDGTSSQVVDQNLAAATRLGYGHNAAPEVTLAEIAPHLDITEHGEGAADNGNGPATVTTYLRCRNGTEFPAEVSLQWSKLNGRKSGLIVARDIAERRTAEEALRESEERYRLLFEEMISGFVLHEMIYDDTGTPVDYRILDFNPASQRIIGISAQDIVGKRISELAPDKTPEMVKLFVDVVEGGSPKRFEHAIPEQQKYLDVVAFKTREKQFATMFTDITDRVQTEQALSASERRLAEAQRLAHVGSWEWDLETGEEYWSDEFYRLFGMEPGAVPADRRVFLFQVYDTDREKLTACFEDAIAGKAPGPMEFRVVSRDGSVRHIYSQVALHRGEARGTARLFGTMADITERKEAEKALCDSEARLHAVIQNSPASFFMKDGDGRYLFANQKHLDWHRVTLDQVLGRTIHEYAPKHIADEYTRFDRQVINFGKFREREIELAYPDGKRRFTIGTKYPIFGEDGQLLCIAGYSMDITERKAVETALQESEMRYRVLIDSSPVPILVHDDERVIFINGRAISALGGTSLTDFIDRPISDVVPAQNQTADPALAQDEDVTPPFAEQRLRRLDGTEFLAEVGTTAIEFEGRPVVQMVFHDITERKRAEEATRALRDELAHVARVSAMGEMAAGFAHELNQPLTAISNYAVGAIRRINSVNLTEKDTERVLQLVADQARRAGEIIRRIRRFVAKGTAEKSTVDLNEAILETAGLLNGEALKNEVELDLDLQEDLPDVMGDVIQIQQVILNLARNGIEAMGESSSRLRKLVISTELTAPETVLVKFSDTGPGLSPVVLKNLFDPFFTTKPGGMGMGLSICRSIIQAHDSELTVQSDKVAGAVFSFTLPTRPQPTA